MSDSMSEKCTEGKSPYVSLCILSYGLSGLRAIVFVSSVCSHKTQIGEEGDADEVVHGGKGKYEARSWATVHSPLGAHTVVLLGAKSRKGSLLPRSVYEGSEILHEIPSCGQRRSTIGLQLRSSLASSLKHG